MSDHIRVYLVIDAAANRTAAQWQTLISGAKLKPLAAGIIAAARVTDFPHNIVNINRASLPDGTGKYRWTLGDFEVDRSQVDSLLALLDAQAALRGITGFGQRETFRRVLLAELQDVAVAAGFPALAPLLALEIVGFGARETAIADVNVWLIANKTNWEVVQD